MGTKKSPTLFNFEKKLFRQFERLRCGVTCAQDILMTVKFEGLLSKTVVVLSYSDVMKEYIERGSLERLPVKSISKYLRYYEKYESRTVSELIYVESNLIHVIRGNVKNSLHMMLLHSFNKKFSTEII